MIKQLAALALTGFVSLGFASPSVAKEFPRQPFDLDGVNFLLRTVEATGHKIYNGGGPCDVPRFYGAASGKLKALVICEDNHRGDDVELGDTIRHEAFHLAQFCKAKKFGATNALLFPDASVGFIKLAVGLGMPVDEYTVSDLPYEAEARAVAHLFDEYQVAQMVAEQCS